MNNEVKILQQDDEKAIVGGWGVLFGGEDLVGEHFDPDTDFALDMVPRKSVYYDHALDEVKHPLGVVVKNTIEDLGIWVEAQLDRSKVYVEEVLKLIEEGVLGWSSGSVGHLIQAEGKAIKRWPIVEFSLTPTPAEPRTLGVERLKILAEDHPELRALIPQGSGEDPESAGTVDNKHHKKTINNEESKMTDVTLSMDEYKDLLKAQVKTPDVAPKPPKEAEDPKVKALSDKLDALVEQIENSAPLKDAGYVAPDSENDHAGTKSLGDFLVAVKRGNVERIKSVYKTALAEDAGATGGYLVPEAFEAPIIAAAKPFSVLRELGATVIPGRKANQVHVPAMDIETAPSAGDTAWAGGVAVVWEEEAASIDESEPRFRQITLNAHKMAAYSLASNELIADSPLAVESLLSTLFGRAIGSKENYAFLRGDGVGKPKGILDSGALVSITRATANKIALSDLADMMSRFMPTSWGSGAWLASPAAAEQIIALVSNPISWLPDIRSGMPAQLLGMPLRFSGALPALNVAGDILLVDPSYYLIYDRSGIEIAYSEHYKFVNDQGTWRVTKRVDGVPWVDGTITLENASSTVSPYVAIAAG